MRSRAVLRVLGIGLVLGATALLAAPSAPAAGPVRMTIGVPGDLGTLDITEGTSEVAREVWRLQYPTLTGLALDTLDTIPGIASDWTSSADRRTWTYTVRSDATWSDGTPVTAGDVVYSLDRARDEAWPYADGAFAGLTAEARDDRTVVVRTDRDTGALPTLLLHVVPKHVFERDTDVGDDGAVVAAGDWHVVERSETSARLGVVERPGRPPLDEIVYRAYPDTESLLAALDRGDVDVAASLPRDALEGARDLDDVTVIHANDGDQWTLQVRIDDADVRAGLRHAFDRRALVDAAAGGVGRPQSVPVLARAAQWRLEPDDARAIATDLDHDSRAAADALAPVAGTTLTVAAADGDDASAIAAFIRESLAPHGVEVDVVGADTADAADLVLRHRDATDDPSGALAPYTCAAGRPCDATIDELARTVAGSPDLAARIDAARAATRRLAETGSEVTLFAPDELQAFRTDNVIGFLRQPDEQRLVTFWPSTLGYSQTVETHLPGGETIPLTNFVVVAVVVTAGAVAAYLLLLRRRAVDGDVERAVGGEGLTGERSPA